MFPFSKNQNIWSVPVIFDGGDSPFIANHLASLAVGMAEVRARAQKGDLIIGLAGEGTNVRLVYLFSVEQILSAEKYHTVTRSTAAEDATFAGRIPKNIIDHGDSIYPPNSKNPLPSWLGRSAEDYRADISVGKNVLLSQTFYYFGRGDQHAIFLPANLTELFPSQGYRNIAAASDLGAQLETFLAETLQKNDLTSAGKYGTPAHLPELEGFDFVMSCETLSAEDDGCGARMEGRVLIDTLRDLQRVHDMSVKN